MSKEDDDWKAFMDSVDDPDEPVETDPIEDSEDEDSEENDDENTEDKSKKSKKAAKGGKAEDDEESDEDDSEEEDDAEDADKGKKPKTDTYKPRLKQFLNDDGSLDPERIEKSYIENSKETVRINGELQETKEKYDRLVEAIKAKPDAAKILLGEEGAKNLAKGGTSEGQQQLDPITAHVKAQLDNQSKREYKDFVDEHPESVTDPDKAQKIGRFLKIFGEEYREANNGELPSMKNGLEAAYRYYGWDLEISKKEEVANAGKKKAATKSTPNKKTPAPKQKKNELEGFFAKKLGVKVK